MVFVFLQQVIQLAESQLWSLYLWLVEWGGGQVGVESLQRLALLGGWGVGITLVLVGLGALQLQLVLLVDFLEDAAEAQFVAV